MRRVLVAGLAGVLLLSACTDDGDPTVDTPPSDAPTLDAAPSDEVSEPTEDPLSSETAEPTEGPSPVEATEPEQPSVEPGDQVGTTLMATLTGAEEVPGPGDDSGSGTFAGTITTTENGGELCYLLRVEDLTGDVAAAHIHQGAAGTSGGVFIDLAAPTGGEVEECVTLNATELLPLLDDPDGYYVNVHTSEFPDGAVRGQLSVASA